ncbi:MAG: hypothetical protein HYY32_00880 [Chloroflexi bacterium]|nr:hypothetical protein [Chloroflexota bacterium]
MTTRTAVHYEVLSPWADVDPQPLRGLTPGVRQMEGKTIGLLANHKYTARPILTIVERKLKQRYPSIKTSWHKALRPYKWAWNTGTERPTDPEIKEWVKDLQEWSKGVDAVVAAIGD